MNIDGVSYCTPGNSTCNYNEGSLNLFSGEIEYYRYGHNVEKGAAYAFLIIFGVSSIIHFFQGALSKHRWTLICFSLGAAGETIGWGGRLWSATSTKWLPDSGGFWWSEPEGFLIQISTLIISPAFFSAGDYILLGRVMNVLGSEYSFVTTSSYAILCIAGDILSLVIQAIGGGMASAADTSQGQKNGADVMVAGIFIQVAIMTFYSIVLVAYIIRWWINKPFTRQVDLFAWWPNFMRMKRHRKNRQLTRTPSPFIVPQQKGQDFEQQSQDSRFSHRISNNPFSIFFTQKDFRNAKIELAVCVLTTTLIYVRSIYRAIELIDGWTGPVISNQALFNGMDAALMAAVVLLFNIFHPWFWLPAYTTFQNVPKKHRHKYLQEGSGVDGVYDQDHVNAMQTESSPSSSSLSPPPPPPHDDVTPYPHMTEKDARQVDTEPAAYSEKRRPQGDANPAVV